jgi:AmmeMemoRadiSam system protein A
MRAASRQAPDDISPPDLARMSVETFVRHGRFLLPPAAPQGVLSERAGAFVTLRTVENDLRGCIGTIEPARASLAEEVIQNAISAATRDPRFAPVSIHELSVLTYGVDVLSQLEEAGGPQDLDPALYGVIIESLDGGVRAVLLPRIQGIETVEHQWSAVHQKAGIALDTPVRVQRFTVQRFGKD